MQKLLAQLTRSRHTRPADEGKLAHAAGRRHQQNSHGRTSGDTSEVLIDKRRRDDP